MLTRSKRQFLLSPRPQFDFAALSRRFFCERPMATVGQNGERRNSASAILRLWLISLARILRDSLIELIFGFYFKFVSSVKNQKLPPVQSDILLESATALAQQIRSGNLTSAEVVEAYIRRINEVNPIINAVVADRFGTARREAAEVDSLISQLGRTGLEDGEYSKEKKPFLGVPLTVKECIELDGMPNTSGSLYRKGILASQDAEVVKRLRDAGAIPIASTNICEICMWWETYNNVYGLTKNPYDQTRMVGGSSGGEGALVASAGSVIGIGTDIGGSVRIPAFMCGVFGHKPTVGLVPVSGQFPGGEDGLVEFNNVGPFCRYAADLLPMLKVMAGSEGRLINWNTKLDSGLRVHYLLDEVVTPTATPVQPEIRAGLLAAVRHLEDTFKATIIPPAKFAGRLQAIEESTPIFVESVLHEPTHSYCSDLVNGKGYFNGGTELIKWLFGKSKHTLPAILLGLQEKQLAPESERARILGLRENLKAALKDILGDNGILVFPTHPRTAPYHYTSVLTPMNIIYTAILNTLGFPSTHVPLGLDKSGLPFGVQVISNHYGDGLTIAVAKKLERAFGGWRCP